MVLYRNTHANMVHQAAAAPAGTQVFIERVRLWCPIIRPSLQAVVDIENKLNCCLEIIASAYPELKSSYKVFYEKSIGLEWTNLI